MRYRPAVRLNFLEAIGNHVDVDFVHCAVMKRLPKLFEKAFVIGVSARLHVRLTRRQISRHRFPKCL